MAVRALIIAIENYAHSTAVLAKSLPGTLQAGLDFRDWLVKKWAAEGIDSTQTQVLFCSEPVQPGGRGATRADIVASLAELQSAGRDQTDELFVFFSGHGFAFVDGEERADIIIASDFVNAVMSGQACLNLDWIVDWLRSALGKGRHYYFIDACRNKMSGTNVAVSNQLLPRPPAGSSNVSTYVLQSTVDGSFARVGEQFPKALIEGLHGKGKAKVWDTDLADGMRVKYDSLRRFVTSKLDASQPITSNVKGPQGESDAVLATIRPIPTVNLKIDIAGASGISGMVQINRGRGAAGVPQAFPSWPQTIPLQPDTYTVEVQLGLAKLSGNNPLTLELYEDYEHKLQHVAPAGGSTSGQRRSRSPGKGWIGLGRAPGRPPAAEPPRSPQVRVDVVVPPRSSIKLRNIDTGAVQMVEMSQQVQLPPGRYSSSLRTSNRSLVERQDLELIDGEIASVDGATWKQSVPMASIAERFPLQNDWPDFSESMGGPVVDPDLDIWLALVGGGRILNGIQGEDFSKLSALPLHDFGGEPEGGSPVYIIAGFQDPDRKLDARIEVAGADWAQAEDTGLVGVREFYQAASPGPHLISLRLDGRTTYTVASAAMANRATLITLSLDADQRWQVGQYLLPLGHQVARLPNRVRYGLNLGPTPLEKLRFLAQVQRSFRRREDLRKEFQTGELAELLYAKWLDPIGSALVSYELIRRGNADPESASHGTQLLAEVVGNMRQYFSELPDTAALAALTRRVAAPREPVGVPLFQDGLRAWPEEFPGMPFPASHLDYNSIWTAWRVAVK